MSADVETRTRLRCDEPGCKTTFPPKGTRLMFGGWQYTRALAAERGWRYHIMRGDFCPDHPAPSSSPEAT